VAAEHDALLASSLSADGTYAELLVIPAGGSALPLTHELLDQRMNCIKMSGREVFKLAVNAMAGACEDVLEKARLRVDHIRWLIPHQANTRIISAVGSRLGVSEDKVYINLDRYGNTSAASVPIALDEVVRRLLVAPGDYLLLTAFGGGLTWGAQLIQWRDVAV
jgi:3-oxoacyl-[acyl-carrier-protein] synthase-3